MRRRTPCRYDRDHECSRARWGPRARYARHQLPDLGGYPERRGGRLIPLQPARAVITRPPGPTAFTLLRIQANMTPLGPKRTEMMVARLRFLMAGALLVCISLIAWGATAQQSKLVIFAAASLKDALDQVNNAYLHDKGHEAITSYAASSTLA